MAETKRPNASEAGGNTLLGDTIESADEKGYFGTVPDEKPNEAYTVAGVTAAMSDEDKARPVARPLARAGDRSGQSQGSSSPARTNEPDGTADEGK